MPTNSQTMDLPTWEETEESTALPAWEETQDFTGAPAATADPALTKVPGVPAAAIPQSIKVSPYEQYKLEHPIRERMGMMGPEQPEGALLPLQLAGAAGRGVSAVTEELMKPVEEISAQTLRDWGIAPAQPGVPMYQGPIFDTGPESLAAKSPLVKGIEEGIDPLIRGFTTPGSAAVLFAGGKPAQAIFGAGAAAQIPEGVQQMFEAQTAQQFGRAAATAGGSTLMAGLIGRHMMGPEPVARSGRPALTPEEVRARIELARQSEGAAAGVSELERIDNRLAEIEQQYGPRDKVIQNPDGSLRSEANRILTNEEGELLKLREKTSQQTEAAAAPAGEDTLMQQLQPHIDNNRQLGIGTDVQIIDKFGETPKDEQTLAKGLPAKLMPDGSVKPGRILISRSTMMPWLESLPEKQRGKALASVMAEEGIHATITPEEAKIYWDSLSQAERALGTKLYVGPHTPQSLQLTEAQLGMELVRQRMQRLLRMQPSEIAELAWNEGWTARSIEALMRIIRKTRETIGTRGAKEGLRVTDAILERYGKGLDAALMAVAERAGGAGAAQGGRVGEAEAIAPALPEREAAPARPEGVQEADDTGIYPEGKEPTPTEEAPFAIRRTAGEPDAEAEKLAKDIGGINFDGKIDWKLPGMTPKWQFTLTEPGMETTIMTEAG